jgi:hypothetical protein
MTAARKKSPIAAIQIERKKHPHLVEDEPWRDYLENRTGQRKLTEMTPAQLQTVLLGLRPDNRPHHGKPRHVAGDQMGMIRAQWIEIAKLGGIQNAGEEALAAWIAKTSGQDIGLLDVVTAQKLIEQLKQWRRRLEGAKA